MLQGFAWLGLQNRVPFFVPRIVRRPYTKGPEGGPPIFRTTVGCGFSVLGALDLPKEPNTP